MEIINSTYVLPLYKNKTDSFKLLFIHSWNIHNLAEILFLLVVAADSLSFLCRVDYNFFFF